MSVDEHRDGWQPEGAKWVVLYGSYDSVERSAVHEIQRRVSSFVPYVVQIRRVGDDPPGTDENVVLVGTPENNRWIRQLINDRAIQSPPGPQGYSLACLESPFQENRCLIVVAGGDSDGVLHGAHELLARILSDGIWFDFSARPRDGYGPIGPIPMTSDLERIPNLLTSGAPAIDHRGIWTWGYAIYDYRRFFANMARLKLNMVTIWNNTVPINASEVIEYAHSYGIRVIMGFHWGWGRKGLSLTDADDMRRTKEEVVRTYKEQYASLDLDGIYFQTLTEHLSTEQSGGSTAALACDWVNEIASALFEVEPDLSIQFGLHAASIREHYADLRALDRRITIVWEDVAGFPYAYNLSDEDTSQESVQQAIDYTADLVHLRPGLDFGMVPKGWTQLKWRDFHGPYVLGEEDPRSIREALRERETTWRFLEQSWLQHYPKAAHFYRELLAMKPEGIIVTGLLEDTILEETIPLPIALYAEMLWDPFQDDAEILRRAMSSYYRC